MIYTVDKASMNIKHLHETIERRGVVVINSASYSEGPGFQYRARDQLSWLDILWLSSVPVSAEWLSASQAGLCSMEPVGRSTVNEQRNKHPYKTTERRSVVFRINDSYSGEPVFESRREYRLSWLFEWFSSVPSSECCNTIWNQDVVCSIKILVMSTEIKQFHKPQLNDQILVKFRNALERREPFLR
jgi:hypothetical protein